MIDYSKLSIFEIMDKIKTHECSAQEVVEFFIQKTKENEKLNAIVEIFDDVVEKAKEIDKKIQNNEKLGKLVGIPVAIKDNILYSTKKAGCASAFMQDFVSPYSATIVEKLLDEDAIIFGRTNMDEFAMGGSTEKSIYGVCHNAKNFEYVAGGSSGGSAVAVSAGLVPVAIGTDTGGSIRQPSSYNGVVGVKPTYGTVSRYGIVAFASSLDQASPITKTISECEYVLKILAGKDDHDQTTIQNDFASDKKDKYRLGICKEVVEKLKERAEFYNFENAIKKVSDKFEIVDVSIPHISSSLACYYIIAPAEASSNLARFDGVKYTKRVENCESLEDVYVKSRSEGFGKEVKRRIMLGNFVLSSGYYDAFYGKAKNVQKLIKKEFKTAFLNCDAIILPTTLSTAFKIGSKNSDPVEMYMEDLFTVPANIAGIPAVSVPYSLAENGLPLGMQFMADEMQESKMFEIAKIFKSQMEVE